MLRLTLLSFLLLLAMGGRLGAVDFPLTISDNGRYFVDQKGQPFFYQADTPWQLSHRVSFADVDHYLATRKAQGFTALQIMLATYRKHTADIAGNKPFINDLISQPNPAYFDRVDVILKRAQEEGFVVTLVPLWMGYASTDYFHSHSIAGCRAYGEFLGQRYGAMKNIIWMLGGDADPRYKIEEVRELAAAIKDGGGQQMMTYHASHNALSSSKFFSKDAWHVINSAYLYGPTYTAILKDYNTEIPRRPVKFSEGYFELLAPNTTEATPPIRVRHQAWWSMTSGAAGHAYGCHTVWNFTKGWKTNLTQPGALHMGHVRALLEPRAWWQLVPDQQHQLVTAGRGDLGTTDYVTAARTADGRLGVAYLPTARTISVDMGRMSGTVTARWYDPTSGRWTTIADSPFANSGVRSFASPEFNDSGDSDMVLVLENVSSNPPPANQRPTVALSSPADGANFSAGSAITIAASASDSDGSVSKVEFYAGSTLLATDSNGADGWSYSWTNASVGPRLLTARAYDNVGAATTSASHTIEVIAAPAVLGINLVGGTVTMDGLVWRGYQEALDQGLVVHNSPRSFSADYATTTLKPDADAATRQVLGGSLWMMKPMIGTGFGLSQPVANGTYDVSVWVIENYLSNSRDMDLRLEGAVVASGIGELSKWSWRIYGPYQVTVEDGVLDIDVLRKSKGDPSISGVLISPVKPADATLLLGDG